MRFKAHSRVLAGVEKKRGLLCGGVDVVVVGKLGKREEGMPVVLSLSDKDLQILFQLLVNSFSLSVRLWVVGCGGCALDPEQPVQFLHECSDKLWSSVGHDLSRETMELPDVAEV